MIQLLKEIFCKHEYQKLILRLWDINKNKHYYVCECKKCGKVAKLWR